MKEFEDELRSALERKHPPAGFAQRVMARRGPKRRRPARWLAGAIAAGLTLSVGGFEYRQYEGRKAKRELLLALEITGSKLGAVQNGVQKKISDMSQRTIHE